MTEKLLTGDFKPQHKQTASSLNRYHKNFTNIMSFQFVKLADMNAEYLKEKASAAKGMQEMNLS